MRKEPDLSSSRNTQFGVTLIELMVTLTVLAVLLTVAIPGFRQLILQQRLSSSTNEIVAGLALTRSESIRKNTKMRFCLNTTTLVWELRDFAVTPNILRQGELSTDSAFTVSNLGSTPVAGYECLDYHSDGLPYNKDGALITNGAFVLTVGSLTRTVRIKTGSVYVQ
jgi:prepilin-type N-terminal cleavage/methylation domain-containing protein